MAYTRSIRGVFTGYSYVSGMCRVCIGYVSGKCRRELGAWGGGMPTTDEHGWTRKHGNTEIYDYNNLNNINQQQLQSTHSPTRLIGDPAARNNTASAKGYGQTTELHGTAREKGIYILLRAVREKSKLSKPKTRIFIDNKNNLGSTI